MLSLHNQQTDLQTCRKQKSGAPNPIDIDTLSQERVSSNEDDRKTLGSSQLRRSLPASPARVQKRRRPAVVTIKVGNKTRTIITAPSSNARHYARRLHAIKGSFEAWLNQPESNNASLSPVNDDAVQRRSTSNSINSSPRYHSASEPETPDISLKRSSKAARDKTEFKCGWVECDKVFDMSSLLRQHVLDCHLTKINTTNEATYTCLWRGCNSSNDLLFLKQSSWEDHLDREHGLGASINTACSEPRFNSVTTGASQAAQLMPVMDSSVAKDMVDLAKCGYQNRSHKVFDDSAPTLDAGYKIHDYDRKTPTLEAYEAWTEEGQTHETQISLNDSAFESQPSLHDELETSLEHVQNRKEAYRAANRQNGFSWEINNGLISSSGGHGTEETEL